MGIRGGARTVGIAAEHRLHQQPVLLRQGLGDPWHEIELLQALRGAGRQQVEHAADDLLQHEVVRGLGDGEVEGRVHLGQHGRRRRLVIPQRGLETPAQTAAILLRGAARGMGGGGALQREADLQHVVAVVRVVAEQLLQGLHDRLTAPVVPPGALPAARQGADEGAAALPARQQALAGEHLDGLPHRGARHPELAGQRALCRQPVADPEIPRQHPLPQHRGELRGEPSALGGGCRVLLHQGIIPVSQ